MTDLELVFHQIRGGIARVHYSYARCLHCEEQAWTRDGIAQIVAALERGEAIIRQPNIEE